VGPSLLLSQPKEEVGRWIQVQYTKAEERHRGACRKFDTTFLLVRAHPTGLGLGRLTWMIPVNSFLVSRLNCTMTMSAPGRCTSRMG
jgi:hypothetical protein